MKSRFCWPAGLGPVLKAKDGKSRGCGWLQGDSLLCIHQGCHRDCDSPHKAHRFKPDESQHREEQVDTKSQPKSRSY